MAPRGKDRSEGTAAEKGKTRKKTKVSSNLGITTSPPHAQSTSHVPPPTCPLSFSPPLYSIPHLGYNVPSSTPFFKSTSSQHMPSLRPGVPSSSSYPIMSSSSCLVIPLLSPSAIQSPVSPIIHSSSSSGMLLSFSQPARNSSMPSYKFTPFSDIPSSSCPVMPSLSSPAIPSSSSSGIRSSFSPIIHSSSSSGMSSSFSHPASYSSIPSSDFTPSLSPIISRPNIGVDGNSTSPYTDSDTTTHPHTQTSTRR
ncbi:uncharacterized serine-rich protein C215.13-like [Nicotiana tomentosiformis]|uniref:uncharacterized serine-rich protein C215.13-like n=1 Tax=Nicotiana tomentosiformis TaxID=4098 RepID=UPI00388CCF9F